LSAFENSEIKYKSAFRSYVRLPQLITDWFINYSNAIKKIGGQLIYEFDDGGMLNVILKVVKNNQEVWTHVSAASN